jgi:hypothetical protein
MLLCSYHIKFCQLFLNILHVRQTDGYRNMQAHLPIEHNKIWENAMIVNCVLNHVACDEQAFLSWRLIFISQEEKGSVQRFSTARKLAGARHPFLKGESLLYLLSLRPQPQNHYILPVASVSRSPILHSVGEKGWFTLKSIIVLVIPNLGVGFHSFFCHCYLKQWIFQTFCKSY